MEKAMNTKPRKPAAKRKANPVVMPKAKAKVKPTVKATTAPPARVPLKLAGIKATVRGPVFARAGGVAMTGVAARTAGAAVELNIFGPIGGWDGITAEQVRAALVGHSDTAPLIVNINSGGGDVFDGIAIHNLLAERDGDVLVKVYGLAASAASIIALAGKRIVMGEGSFFMIHNAWTFAIGDSIALAATSKTLKQVDGELAKMYAKHTGIDADEIAEMMADETWLGADDAVNQNFADGKFSDDTGEAEARADRIDLSAFKNVPKALIRGRKRSAKVLDRGPNPTAPEPDLSPLAAALERLRTSISQKGN